MVNTAIGATRLLISQLGSREQVVTGMDRAEHEAWIVPALVVGPHQTLLEVELRRWKTAGEVVASSRGDSHPYFQRLVQGCRLGVVERSDGGPGASTLGHVVWDTDREWSTVKKAEVSDLDQDLGGDAERLLFGLGVEAIATREQLWSDTSKRRNYLEAHFDPDDPVPPLAIYVLTRVLPVLAAVDRAVR
ncbi:hypothetical protein [Aeromicrobium sp. Leaf291]|uniref:hypothetical protein n=1 Tax=Aeromicrobium sp. Leaf291 TaxID=1736325 RepID=UPI00138F4D0D|nr:hypothetical protein [Aeromicrobium sp. Leaf291]